MNIAGMIAKYFAMSLAIEKVVRAPRVMSSCLPISTTSMSLVGSESRSTMLPASFAAEVPEFIATPTSAWASAGASLVPSPVMATSRPPSCSFRMRRILSSGVASARKSSTPASSAMAAAVSGVVAGDHHGADPHGAHDVEALAHARLDHVLEVDDAERPRRRRAVLLAPRRAACRPDALMPSTSTWTRAGHAPPGLLHPAAHGRRRRPCGCACRRAGPHRTSGSWR